MKTCKKEYDWTSYTIVKVNDTHLVFSNSAEITYYHEQDCCEEVYADFKAVDDYGLNAVFHGEPVIEFCKDAGIRINGAFIPCYNLQNGWYSGNLDLICSWKDEPINISECAKFEEW